MESQYGVTLGLCLHSLAAAAEVLDRKSMTKQSKSPCFHPFSYPAHCSLWVISAVMGDGGEEDGFAELSWSKEPSGKKQIGTRQLCEGGVCRTENQQPGSSLAF